MSSRDRRGPGGRWAPNRDELDGLLARSVRDLVGDAKPSSQVWQRIEDTLRAGPSPSRQRASRSVWRTGSLAQALAVASLLVVLGLSLGPLLQWQAYLYGSGEQIKVITRTPETAVTEESVPVLAEEGLLSGRELLQQERERARERQVMARAASPSLDPILQHRLDRR